MVSRQDLWWAQAGDSVSPHNIVMEGLEPGLRKLLEENSYRNLKVGAFATRRYLKGFRAVLSIEQWQVPHI